MNPKSAAAAYREAALENAPPLKVVHLLYEGALRFIDQAVQVDPGTEPLAFQEKLGRADAVVSELRLSLDHGPAPELSERLDALYLFVEERLRTAILDRSTEPLPAARNVLETLLDGWKEVDLQSRGAA